jgi:hypothetical protein
MGVARGKKCGRLPLEKQIGPRSATKPGRSENPDVMLGRIRPTSACHCSSPSGLPTNCGAPFSTLPRVSYEFHRSPSCYSVLTCLHSIAIFSLHTIQALCFSIFSFESHFLLSFSLHTIQALCFSKKFFESHFFVCLSHHGTFSRAKFPDSDEDGFKLFTSLVHCPSHNTSSSTQIQERLAKMILQHC